jgi:transcriptional regulator with XRE-family HTH domain
MAPSQKPDETTPPGTRLPEYAVGVMGLRHATAMTQPELASRLKVRRGAVARWEAGLREPRDANYEGLAVIAGRRGDTQLRDLFLSLIQQRKSHAKEKRLFSRRYQARVERALGTNFKEHIIELSEKGSIELAEHQFARMGEAKKSLKERAFSERFYQITLETEAVRLLWSEKERE